MQTRTELRTLKHYLAEIARIPAELYRPKCDDGGCDFEIPLAANSAVYNGGEQGECYFAAVSVLVDLRCSGIVSEVIHGVVDGMLGTRMLHGWVEIPFVTPAGRVRMCVDASHTSGPVRVALKSDYYRILNVRRTRNYTIHDIQKIVSSGIEHCGAWETPLEPCAELEMLRSARRNSSGYCLG